MSRILLMMMAAALAAACGHRRPSMAELQQKIDSVRTLELERQLRLQGIKLEASTPFQMFYDSLRLQPLPLEYSEEYVKTLPGFIRVPEAIVTYLDLEGRLAPRAIALPETLGSRLVLLAADLEDGEYELWLYSLDSDYIPVDKLMLYEPPKFSERRLETVMHDPYFSITSYYDIHLVEYVDDYDRKGQLSTYIVDDSRMFVEKEPF